MSLRRRPWGLERTALCHVHMAPTSCCRLHLALEESERSMEQAKEEFRLLLKEAKEASQQSPLQVDPGC